MGLGCCRLQRVASLVDNGWDKYYSLKVDAVVRVKTNISIKLSADFTELWLL
jgi:hypothetical protein